MWIIAFVLLAAVFAVLMLGEQDRQNKAQSVVDDYFNNGYKQDIDFSLAAKGYPVVGDVEIAYSEWLAANPGKVV